MRTILGLAIFGLITGDGLIAIIVAVKLFAYKDEAGYRHKTLIYIALLFLAVAIHLTLLLAAFGELPKPTPEIPHPRPLSFRIYVLAALSILALGVWPSALHFVGLVGKKEAE
jgi:predicted membrane channel-forming protein YqfA (hemolysin III family)